jgi:hypothetical protein
MDDTQIAHQTPLMPIFPAKNTASGIRNVLNPMLITAGMVVFPIPLNIPCVVKFQTS